MIYVLDKYEKVIAVLSNDNPKACPYFNDTHTENLADYLSIYEFEAPATHEDAVFLVADNYVARQDADGNFILFQIKRVEETQSDGRYIKKVHAENAVISDLYGEIIRPATLNGYSAPAALDYVLQGTRWTRGEVDYLGAATIEFKNYETALQAVQMVAKAFGGEIRYRVDLVHNQISKKYVDILEQRGQDTGKRFEYHKDIIGVRRIEDSTQLATAIIPLGNADASGKRMTIESVNNGVDYVADDEARDRWSKDSNHIFAVYEDSEAQNPADLKNRALQELDRRKNPIYNYEVDVVLLESMTGWEHEAVRLGDQIKVIDYSMSPELLLDARIIELTRSYTDPTQDKAVLGEFVPLFVDIPSVVKRMNQQLASTSGIANQIYKGTTPPEDTSQLWLDTSNPSLNVWKRYDDSSSTWVKATPTAASEVGAETPSGAQAKADNAKNTAISTAATDATNKANTAEANAKGYTDKYSLLDGVSVGGVVTATFNINKGYDGSTDAGEIQVDVSTGNKFVHPNGTEYTITGSKVINTTLDGSGSDYRYICFIGSDTSRFNFPYGTQSRDFIAITFQGGAWKYDNDQGLYPFTPNANDCIVAKVEQSSSGGLGNLIRYAAKTLETTAGAQAKADAAQAAAISTAAADATTKADNAKNSAISTVADGIGSHKIVATPPTSATSAYHNNASGFGLYITTTEPVHIGEVTMIADTNGTTGTVILRDQAAQTTIVSKTVTLNAGTNKVDLNFDIPAAGNYWLGVDTGWTGGQVQRTDRTAVTYPYNSGSFQITGGGQRNSTNDGYYYYFYNINVRGSSVVGQVPSNLTVKLDQVVGGNLNLGGAGDGNGRVLVLGDDGETLVDLSTSDGGFKVINAGYVNSDSVVNANSADLSIYVDANTGDDERDTSTSSAPYKSIARALKDIPSYNNGTITINISSDLTEYITLKGFIGYGTINFQLNNHTINGSIYMSGCSNRINFYNGTINAPAEVTYAIAEIHTSPYVMFSNVKFYGRGSTITYGIAAIDSSFVYVTGCHVQNVNRALRSGYNGHLCIESCTGKGLVYGLNADYGGVISGKDSATVPGGATNTLINHGGELRILTPTYDGTTNTVPATPPTVKTFPSNSGDSYRSSYVVGWRNSADVRQGQWSGYGLHSGLWFFGDVRSVVGTKTVSKVRLTCTRKAEGGYSGAVTVYFRPHIYASKPGGAPSFLPVSYAATFKWGETKTITLPSSFNSYFSNGGTAQGIGIYTSSTSNDYYAIFDDTATLELTYS